MKLLVIKTTSGVRGYLTEIPLVITSDMPALGFGEWHIFLMNFLLLTAVCYSEYVIIFVKAII